jgi:RNA polymerase sigma-70 factor (ECF subfamily)
MKAVRPKSDSNRSAALDLDSIYREHAEQVARWVAHLGGPGIEVDDVVHEVFLVVERRLGEFRGDARLTTWLYRIAERVTRESRRTDRLRRWLRWARHADVVSALAPVHLTPVDELERQQARQRVYAALDRLPEKYRTVLVLFELEGLATEEIASLTGVKPATVGVRLHRARPLFLNALDRQGGGKHVR